MISYFFFFLLWSPIPEFKFTFSHSFDVINQSCSNEGSFDSFHLQRVSILESDSLADGKISSVFLLNYYYKQCWELFV